MTKQEKMKRRDFIKLAGGAVGAAVLACSGLAFIGTRRPKLDLETANCSGGNDTDKVLVTYATRCGSTIGVAEAIGQTLCDKGASVDIQPVEMVDDLSAYSAVVAGSAIRMGKWLPEAANFVEQHQNVLNAIPTAYFTVCMTLQEDTPENRQAVAEYVTPVRDIVKPVDEGLFAGAFKPEMTSWVETQILNALDTPQGDFRDWDAIQAWGEGLHALLQA